MIRVLYRLRVRAEAAARFPALWHEGTMHIQERAAGARGSVLLRVPGSTGEFRALARWDSQAAWAASRSLDDGSVPPAVAAAFRAALAEPTTHELLDEIEEAAGLPGLPVVATVPAAGAPHGAWASVFVGVSVDGFLARPDGALDFLPEGGGEPHGYEQFTAGVDALVIGRKTFETVRAFPEWPYGSQRVVVLSGGPLALPSLREGSVERMAGTPAQILERLSAQGLGQVYVDGGLTIQGFLRAGLVRRLVVTRVPVLIGQGIPLFGALPADVILRHVATRSYASGLVQSEYWIDPPGAAA
jgi:dihydrofolate reductase